MDWATITAGEALSRLVDTLARPQAYLDPGSGSYLLQLLIAGALGALFVLRGYIGRFKDYLLRKLGKGSDDEGEPGA